MNTNPFPKQISIPVGVCFVISGLFLLVAGQLLARGGRLIIS